MKVIPVLDVLDGRIVRGVAGRRSEYRPIVSRLTSSDEPLTVARAIRDAFGLNHFYVADLDGIVRQRPNFDLYRRLIADGFLLLIDAGVRDADDALRIAETNGADIIVGLESCRSPDDLTRISALNSEVTFSLDLLNGAPCRPSDHCGWYDQPVEIIRQVVKRNITSILVLDLADVGMGTGGSTDSICRCIRGEFPAVQLTAGGGIRHRDDLSRFSELGVDSVLVASALHDGRLVRDDFR